VQSCERCAEISPRSFRTARGIDLQLNEPTDGFHRVAKHEVNAFASSEQVADHRKTTALHIGKVERRTACFVNSPLNFRGFEVRVDLRLDPHQMSGPLEISNTLPQISIPHQPHRSLLCLENEQPAVPKHVCYRAVCRRNSVLRQSRAYMT